MKKVFIDGSAGTTGLRIHERLANRKDIKLVILPDEVRKDNAHRKNAINNVDVAFLCLPDVAAIEAVSLLENNNTVIIDTSTAHRTLDDWAYGFPELSPSFEEKIKTSKRIAVPGCHASGFIALVYPLIEAGIISKDLLLTCHSITGYSGGGKNMISDYEGENSALLNAPRQYALGQEHKHLKEMAKISGLNNKPIFSPIVSSFYSGMEVTVPLFSSQLSNGKAVNDIINAYKEKYNGPLVEYCEKADDNGFLSATTMANKDSMKISVYGNEDRILLTALYDNLGKGASGAAIECLNIVLGLNKDFGLEV